MVRRAKKKRKTILKKRWFWDFVLASILIGSLSFLLFNTYYFKINNIEFSGSESTLSQRIKNIVNQDFNFFTLDTEELSAVVEEAYPQLEQVEIKKKFPSSIEISTQKRNPVAFLCKDSSNKKCFLIGEKGVLFDSGGKIKKNELIKVELAEENSDKKGENSKSLGENILPNKVFLQILGFGKELEEKNIKIKKIRISDFDITLKVRNKGKEDNFKIYFSRRGEIKFQANVFLKAWKEKIPEQEKKDMKYVDLRNLKKDSVDLPSLKEDKKGVYFK